MSVEQECRNTWTEAEHWHRVALHTEAVADGGWDIMAVVMCCAATAFLGAMSYGAAHPTRWREPDIFGATITGILSVGLGVAAVSIAVRSMLHVRKAYAFIRKLRGWL